MSADRQYAISAQFRRTLGIDLLPTQTGPIEDLVEASIAEGGPGWPEFAEWLREAQKFWPSPVRRRAEGVFDSTPSGDQTATKPTNPSDPNP